MVIGSKRRSTNTMIIVLILLGVVVVSLTVLKVKDKRLAEQEKTAPGTAQITNYDECVAAGNPVMESYPEQCAAGGQTFTRVIQEPEPLEKMNSYNTVVDSGQSGFSITIPDGWNVIKDAQRDFFIIPGDQQPKIAMGTKPTITTSDGYGSDGPAVFSVFMGTEFDASLPLGTETVFSIGKAETLVEGKRYAYIYEEDQQSDGIGGGRLEGDRDYTYIFMLKDGRQLRAWYNIYGSDPVNNIATIEDVLRTITIK